MLQILRKIVIGKRPTISDYHVFDKSCRKNLLETFLRPGWLNSMLLLETRSSAKKSGNRGRRGFHLEPLLLQPPSHPQRKSKEAEARAKTPVGSSKSTRGTDRTASAGKVGPVKEPTPTTGKKQPQPPAKAKKKKDWREICQGG